MIELSVNNLTKYYGASLIFENISFDIKTKERVALIGKNGAGKTTLMKILMGLEPYQGNVSTRKGATLGYLDQLPNFPDEFNVLNILCLAFEDIYNVKDRMHKLEESFSNLDSDKLSKAMNEYSNLQANYECLGGYDIDEKLSKITIGLDINSDMLNMPFNSLSGGEKTRVILGKILLESPNILLLDEPSNHLDMKSIEWLESYLSDYKGSVLIISHDRYFLDKVATKIIELESDCAEIYKGNYSYYLTEKDRRYEEALKNYQIQQKQIKKMKEQIERYRIWGEMRDSNKMFIKAKELEKRLDKIDVMQKPSVDNPKIKIDYGNSGRSGKEVVVIEELEKSFDSKTLFRNLNLTLFYKNRLSIMGDNGAGKSTLLKIILGLIPAEKGIVTLGANIVIGYLPQEISFENEDISILDFFQFRYGTDAGESRRELAKVLFVKDDVFKSIKSLSGGEKTRLKICILMYEHVNFLILDEPTNHLDIESREILEASLLDFSGTILFVSHDRYFINKIATSICEIENQQLKLYNGDFEYYKSEKEKILSTVVDNMKVKTKVVNKSIPNKSEDLKKKNKKLENQLIKLEEFILSIETDINSIDSEMELFPADALKLNSLLESKCILETQLAESYITWESLNIELETSRSDE